MKTCSPEFLAAASATVRRPNAKVEIVWTDPTIDSSIVVSSNGDNRVSCNEHVHDTITTTPYKYALLDGTFTLDGTCHPFPGTATEKRLYQVGWYSNRAPTGGTDWVLRSSAEDNNWQAVCYGNGLFVAVAGSGTHRVMTSPDGITWTPRIAPLSDWRAVCYGDGLFVAVASSQTVRVMTSPDGITWTPRTLPTNVEWYGMCYGNGLFVATGYNMYDYPNVYTSPDGVTWTKQTLPIKQTRPFSICYGNGLFVAVAGSQTPRVMTSPDGITWIFRTPAEDNYWRAVCYGNGLFVAVADSGMYRVMTSPDGITWTPRTAPLSDWRAVCYGDGLFVAVASSQTVRVMTSPDGITWTNEPSFDNEWYGVCYGNKRFVAVASSSAGNRVMTRGTNPDPKLTVEFDTRPIFNIFVVGEPTLGQYPVDFKVQLYNGSELLIEYDITDNNVVEFVQEAEFTTVTKCVLSISRWSTENTVCKITEFYTAVKRAYTGDDIVSIGLLEEREIRDGSLPVGNISSNELDLELQNVVLGEGSTKILDPYFPGNTASFVSALVKPNREVTAYLGFRLPSGVYEFVKVGKFWTGDWEIDDQSFSVTTTCRDRMDRLKRADFDCTDLYENITLYALAEAVLNHARESIPMADLVWSIDPELQNFTVPYAWFEKTDYMNALRDIAEACLGQAYMSKDDVLIIEGPSANTDGTPDIEITGDDYFSKKQPMKHDEIVNVVKVETQPVVVPTTSDTVYTSQEAISIAAGEILDPIEISYSDFPIKDAVADFIEEGFLDLVFYAEEYFPWGARLTVRNLSAIDGTFKIEVSGKVLEVDGSETISAEDAASIRSNGRMEYSYPKNRLVQTREMAQRIADALIGTYATERKDIELNWRGNPAVELGDIFRTAEYQRGSVSTINNFVVYKSTLDFDGTLQGTLYGRRAVPA